eukprot:scaffold6208_cov64-Phaeocystis_antarctica.AAC.5
MACTSSSAEAAGPPSVRRKPSCTERSNALSVQELSRAELLPAALMACKPKVASATLAMTTSRVRAVDL